MEQELNYKGYLIKIKQDEGYESTNDWGNEDIFLVYDHRQFYVERAGFAPQSIYHYLYAKNIVESGDDVDDNYKEELESYSEYDNFHIFPVEAYIHSGVRLSLFNGIKQCNWDSSVSGYLLASKSEFESTELSAIVFNCSIQSPNNSLTSIYSLFFQVIYLHMSKLQFIPHNLKNWFKPTFHIMFDFINHKLW